MRIEITTFGTFDRYGHILDFFYSSGLIIVGTVRSVEELHIRYLHNQDPSEFYDEAP